MRIALLTAMLFGVCGATFAQEVVPDRRMRGEAAGAAVVWVPDGIASGTFAWRVAASAGVPLIFEASPLDYRDPAVVAQRFDLEGLTVREALDILVAQDPRYGWEERDGVIVIRPSGLSRDRQDVLNQRTAGMRGDQLHLEDVVTHVAAAVGSVTAPTLPARVDSHEFALDAPGGTVLSLLVAAARAHGGVMWSVPAGVAVPDQAGFSLGFTTFTGGGTGTTASAPTGGQ